MRHISLALVGLLTIAAGAFAQGGTPPAATGTPEQLNEQLTRWEKEMTLVKSLSARCSRTDVNRVRNENRVLSGYVKCMKVDAGGGKVDKLALLYLAEKDKPDSFEKFICTGNLAYWFAPQEKAIYVKRLGTKLGEDSFLSFLFEMKAEGLRKRFDMTLVRPEDPNYIYIEIKPRLEADKVEFQRARLVLFKRDCLPAQLWFEEPNGNHHTWDMADPKVNDAQTVKPADFVAPEKPAGWQIKEAKEPESKPAVIRPARP
jgi:TIGR03009 family protein